MQVAGKQVLVAELAQALLGACPPGWRAAQVVHRQVGERVEQEASALTDSGAVDLTLPAETVQLFTLLRSHGPLWFTARVRVAPPDRFTLDIDAAEPAMSGGVGWAEACADTAVVNADTLPAWVRRAQEARRAAHEVRTELVTCALPSDSVLVTDAPGPGWRVGRSPGWRVGEPDDGWSARYEDAQVGGLQTSARNAAALALGRVLLDVVRPEGPFTPGPDDPPLSLLQGLRRVVLPAGAMIDRLGESSGTVVWVARTPWPLRSLPVEHRQRPYAAFTLRRGVEVLAGEAVAWFGQPGGGTAFVLPRSVARLVAMGALKPLV